MTHASPLRKAHLGLGARLVDFAGWEMPLQYRGIIHEHTAVRTRAGIFDVSHLGKLVVEGPGASEALDRLLPGKVAGLAPRTAGYNLVLNESGGIVDDIFVYRTPGSLEEMGSPSRKGDSAESFLLIPNAANNGKVFDFLAGSLEGQVKVRNAHLDWAIIALSGPRAREIVAADLPQAGSLKMHHFAEASLAGLPVMVARTGYTGELTFEIVVRAGDAGRVWERLFELGGAFGIEPAGLGARDLLRLEMGYPLHGQDITDETNPVEANLDWVIEWEKHFPGKQALERVRADGSERKLAGLAAASRRIPRRGALLMLGNDEAGVVTSGNFSPSLDAGIAMGYVRTDLASEGTALEARLNEKSIAVKVSQTPFLKQKRRTKGPGETSPVKGTA